MNFLQKIYQFFFFFRRDGLNLAQILLQQPKIATRMHQISSKNSTQNQKNRKNLDFHQFFQSIFLPQKKFLQRKYARSHRVIYEFEEKIEIGADTAENETSEVA